MKVLLLVLTSLAAFLHTADSTASDRLIGVQEAYEFRGITLTDGTSTYKDARVTVRVRLAGDGYTRADYFDKNGRHLGFYEAFEKVSVDEAVLRAWALRNFPDRTPPQRRS